MRHHVLRDIEDLLSELIVETLGAVGKGNGILESRASLEKDVLNIKRSMDLEL